MLVTAQQAHTQNGVQLSVSLWSSLWLVVRVEMFEDEFSLQTSISLHGTIESASI